MKPSSNQTSTKAGGDGRGIMETLDRKKLNRQSIPTGRSNKTRGAYP
jgi:hypothetical protein